MDHQVLFVLGAEDPEMRKIEQLLDESKIGEVWYAMKDGKRVHPGNAYQADPIQVDQIHGPWRQIVLIECQPVSLPPEAEVTRVDHHRPGDHGYNLPPEAYWQASSLGQLWIDYLYPQEDFKGEPDQDQSILAAMDHCPAAAIRGECPGVSAQEVLDRKVAEIASATKHSPDEVRERIAFFSGKIEIAPEIMVAMDGGMLRDIREWYLGEGYSLDLLAAQVAALAGGYAVLLRHRDAPGKPEKWSISGHASPVDIEGFMKHWAPSKDLMGIYGVPSRGYAGGYLPD